MKVSLNHISVIVKDIERSKAFYTNVLGFETVTETVCEGTKLCYMKAEDFMVELEQKPVYAERNHGHVDHISLSVEDYNGYVKMLKDNFVKFEFNDPKTIDDVFGGVKFLVFYGPDKEKFELTGRM